MSILDLDLGSNFDLFTGVVNTLVSTFDFFFVVESLTDNSESISNNDMDDLQLPIFIVSAAFLAACL